MLLALLSGSPFLIAAAGTVSSQTQIAGALICPLGLVLSSISFTQPMRAMAEFHSAPKICRRLFTAGAVLFFAGVVVTPVFL